LTVSTVELRARLRTWRRYLHRHPELSFEEHETSRYVRSQLHALDPAGVLVEQTVLVKGRSSLIDV